MLTRRKKQEIQSVELSPETLALIDQRVAEGIAVHEREREQAKRPVAEPVKSGPTGPSANPRLMKGLNDVYDASPGDLDKAVGLLYAWAAKDASLQASLQDFRTNPGTGEGWGFHPAMEAQLLYQILKNIQYVRERAKAAV